MPTMKIVVLGMRGFPNVQGGVESHCENLYPWLFKLGLEVTVFVRKPYVDPKIGDYKGVRLISLSCPRSKTLEAFLHTFLGVFAAKKVQPDILHIHAIGPSLFVPLARLLGLKVVMTNHGPDYKRKKWGCFGKLVLRLGEALGSISANEIICISETIASQIRKYYRRRVSVIPNGVNIPQILQSEGALNRYGLKKKGYVLCIGRFVPEKGFHDLIAAFNLWKSEGFKLVLVGQADHADRYSSELLRRTRESPNIVLTGFLSEGPLKELLSHAGLFVLPSYYEGLPIALLEAMSYGLSCIASDLPATREVGLSEGRYFKPGNVEGLAEKIKEFASKPLSEEEKMDQIKLLSEKYSWDDIAHKTLEVYRRVLSEAKTDCS